MFQSKELMEHVNLSKANSFIVVRNLASALSSYIHGHDLTSHEAFAFLIQSIIN